MTRERYHNPVSVIDSTDWVGSLEESQKKLGIDRPLVIASQGGRGRLSLNKLFPTGTVFSGITVYPTFESCQSAVDFCRSVECDGVIAVGGGSVMDMAKVVGASLGTGVTDMAGLFSIDYSFPHRMPSIFIPTTHGSGSEVTMWGTVWDTGEKRKVSISHPDLYPDVAILDGSLALGLPLDISLSTVLDALSHSLEAIWNKNRNAVSTDHAIQAIRSILLNGPRLKDNLQDPGVRANLLKAANTAGLAFSNTKTAASHSIGYPLTLHYGVPHGVASSMALLPLLKINRSRIQDELNRLLQELKLGDVAELEQSIRKIPSGSVKFTLKEWGVDKDDLEELVGLSFTRGRMDNNIVDLTEKDVGWILGEIYS